MYVLSFDLFSKSFRNGDFSRIIESSEKAHPSKQALWLAGLTYSNMVEVHLGMMFY